MSNKVIPDYAKDFKREWQYIKGINNKCDVFLYKLIFAIIISFDKDIFNSSGANNIKNYIRRFFKAQERGQLKDISNFYFNYFDFKCIECLIEKVVFYRDFYRDFYEKLNSIKFNIEKDYPGFKDFLELITLLDDKIKKQEDSYLFRLKYDSDSDIDSYSDSDIDSD